MFIVDREQALGENELPMSMVTDILENKAGFYTIGKKRKIITVWTKDNDENFTAIIEDNKLKIVGINGEKVDIRIQRNDSCGFIENKDLDFKYKYSVQSLDDGTDKVTVIQEMNKNTFLESYLQKNDDALLIIHAEEIHKDNLPKDTECDGNFSIVIVNNNLHNVSKEEEQNYIEDQLLGKFKSLKEADNDYEHDEEIFDEEIFNEYTFEEDDVDESEITEVEKEEQILAEYETEYGGFSVMENGKYVEGLSSYEMIDDVYGELIDTNIFLDEATIANIECLFDEIEELAKRKNDPDEPNNPGSTVEDQVR